MPQANSYVCYPDFFIRMPVLPLDYLEVIPENPKLIVDFVMNQWKNPLIRNAILLASPNLFEQLHKETKIESLTPGLIRSFLRYFIRMCYRSTPFGLFAGVGSGEISDITNIRIKDPSRHIMRSRLDMEYLGASVMSLMSDPDIVKELSFMANTSLYKIGLTWRYTEVYFDNISGKKYRIVSVDSNELIDRIISSSMVFRSWKDIVRQITRIGYEEEESEDFVNQLISSQVLITEIYPNLTGEEFSMRLKEKLENIQAFGELPKNLVEMVNDVNSELKPFEFERLYTKVKLQADKSGINYSSSHLIQTDLKCSFESNELSRELAYKVLVGVRILKALSVSRPNKILEEFKDYFVDRFGAREVPLPLVMDSDLGIALLGPKGQQMTDLAPLLDGMDFSRASAHPVDRQAHPLLIRKLKSLQGSDHKYIILERSDFKELGIRKADWPEQLYALVRLSGSILSPSVVFDFASTGNPANIMGRFGYLDQGGKLGRQMEELVRDDKDSRPDCIMAEVVHLPEDRTGNILQRPSYYDWEIPFLATPGSEENVIPTNDILVSIKGNKVVLKERNSGRVILPRLTNAHNYSFRQLPLYQFLAECINQDRNPGFFPEWGWLSTRNEFLPGIKYENLVLSLPMWKIRIEGKLKKPKITDPALYKMILDWAAQEDLPDKLIWVNGDHEMFISWSNENIVMAAWEGIRRLEIVLFKEYPYESGSLVSGTAGFHANEVIVSFKKEK